MKSSHKIAVAVALLLIVVLLFGSVNIRQWASALFTGSVSQPTVVMPSDSSFMPTHHRQYTPPLLSAFGKQTADPPARLPGGVREKDVRRVVSVKYKGIDKPVSIIETKSGDVFVERDSSLERIDVVAYNPPVVAFGLYPGVGISLAPFGANVGDPGRNGGIIQPMVKLSFAEFFGVVRLPMLALDLKGAGLGAEVKLYHDIYVGAGYFASYSNLSQQEFKATLQFNF